MSSNNNRSSSGGISFVGLLQVAFIVLKLLDKIQWSWLWVLAPTWIGLVLVIILTIILVFLDR